MSDNDSLIPRHGGYRNLKTFQVSEVIYDVTVRFCDKFIDLHSRTHDQMVPAARSGRQNIAEGSMASATSKKMEMKLTGVAKASLEEPRLDCEDFLRQRSLPQWDRDDPRRADLIARRPAEADDVARWAKDVKSGRCGQHGRIEASTPSTTSTLSYGEILANQAKAFKEEGGFTERLYSRRSRRR